LGFSYLLLWSKAKRKNGIPVLHGREAGDHGDAFGLIFVRGGVVVFGDGEGFAGDAR